MKQWFTTTELAELALAGLCALVANKFDEEC